MNYRQIDYIVRFSVEIAMSDRSHEIGQAPRNDTGGQAAAFAFRNPQEIATSLRSSQ
jgi:hypothetical protein